jgi:AcrR family transcriptional regulator
MSLYRNFPSKDALVAAWLEDRNAFFWRRWKAAEASRPGDPRGQLEAILDMVAATASHPKWRGCPFLNTGTEFPEPDHPARAVILAHKGAVRERLRALAAAASAGDPGLLAQQLAAFDRRRLRHRPIARPGRAGKDRHQRRPRAYRSSNRATRAKAKADPRLSRLEKRVVVLLLVCINSRHHRP